MSKTPTMKSTKLAKAPKAKAAGATTSSRYNFTPSTKEIIAKRAEWRCVVPGCTNPTQGPGPTPESVVNMGWACHIFAAATNGPRGQNGLHPKDIKDPQNGVWCCTYHGALIDKNDGAAYPASLLQGWRTRQEAEIQRRLDRQATPHGWVNRIVVYSSFLFEADAELQLGKSTVLVGRSDGKTALCDWLSTLGGLGNLSRWKLRKERTIVGVEYYSPMRRDLDLEIRPPAVDRKLDGQAIASSPSDVSIVYLTEGLDGAMRRSDDGDDALIASLVGVDVDSLQTLLADIRRNGTAWGRALDLVSVFEPDDEDDPSPAPKGTHRIRLEHKGVTFAGFGHSGKIRAVVEFAMAAARGHAREKATLLILDSTAWNWDDALWGSYAQYLAAQPFQTIVTRQNDWRPPSNDPWNQWLRVRVAGYDDGRGSSTIVQEPWPV